MTTISASILGVDFAHLAQVIAQAEAFGTDMIHFDVMDGCFVDNLSFGLPVLQSLRRCTQMPLDVHLMIQRPLQFVTRFAEAGADLLSFHIESDSDPRATLDAIHAHGIRAGIALSPETPAEAVFPYLSAMHAGDFILVMTVYPGWGKQAFLSDMLPKIETLHAKLAQERLPLRIQVDGGINAETAAQCRAAGADCLVSGSYLFSAADSAIAVASLRGGI